MSDTLGAAIVFTITLVIFLTAYFFASFSYKISGNYLKMQWRILIYIPFNFFKIKLENIQEVKKSDLKRDLFSGALIFGNLFRRKGVIIVLKKRSLFRKRIFITPENPDKFIEEIDKIKERIQRPALGG
jgi:hypothetical protein